MSDFFRDKVILITGAAGTIGKEIVRQLLATEAREIRLIDNNESELFYLGNKYRHHGPVTLYLGDVRDEKKLLNVTQGVDLIFHLAALKHVGLSEYNPFEAVQTNINGVKHLVQAAMSNNVPRVIYTSSDKAVNPTNVMGTSKLMGERIITAANIVNSNGRQIFSSVRFGNVLGSRGSVVPIFAQQIINGKKITITDARMTRFVMTIQEAAQLVLEAATLVCGGEVLVTKMPVMRIVDLARAMACLLAPQIGRDPEKITCKYVGATPGEKLYEELMTIEEVGRLKELPSMFAILPGLEAFYHKISYSYPDELPQTNKQPYISSLQTPMSVAEIKDYLKRYGILDEFLPPGDSWHPGYGPLPVEREPAPPAANNNYKYQSG
ncbi:MAG: polysaccharide biosynthesis protein [Deltaproteobacteria bacterium]|nr:MAG: polysaccharide biosynthesis protein [Deltaproteobacteria bacterium]